MHRSGRTQGRTLRSALWAAATLLSACVTAPPPAPPPRPWAERAALLQAVQHFDVNGRLATSNGKEGFSAGLHWLQQGSDADLQLTGPLGFGAAHVQLQDGQVSITTSDGKTLAGAAAAAQLARLLGFDPPLQSLRYWVLGVNDPTTSAERSLDEQHRLVELQQDGWQVVYDEYVPVQRHWLPRRLTLTHQQLRLRLVINAWQL